ncbi:MAG: CRISPR-associated endonuclease Cas1 [Gammaproteobacteria bacterium]
MDGNGALPLHDLLPIRGAVITLRFTAPAELHFFHQAALTAFVRSLLGSPEQYDTLLTLDTPECGRISYRPGHRYRFALIGLAGAEALLDEALTRLRNLPFSAARWDRALSFRDNLAFMEARDLFQGHAVRGAGDLAAYTEDSLEKETALWRHAPALRLRWLSPVRLLLDKDKRLGLKGEARFCRNVRDLSFPLLANRLHDAIAALLRRRGYSPPARGPAPPGIMPQADLFWVDSRYKDASAQEQVMGGLLGVMELAELHALPNESWRLWVFGQYLGIGQRRDFGWGRYQLESMEDDTTYPRVMPAASLLEWVAEHDNLSLAYAAIRANRPKGVQAEERDEDDEWPGSEQEEAEDEPEDEHLSDRLQRLAQRLASSQYQTPPLRGVILDKPDGGLRPLAVPPFIDRVAQRAVIQVLSPGLEPLMYHGSFGYRPRRSRHTARQMIQAAYQQGYRWVYESDIDDFFDRVDWQRLGTRLRGLYGEDPLVPLILSWVSAPVEYRGQTIARGAGLPQGSPVSPLLANLMLDDFDSDLETAGFRLARFADDFVILAKDRAEAEAAGHAAAESLADLGLAVNPDKTRILSFDQGFRYLGYLFVNSLALDVSGEPRAPKDTPASIPPASWLARIAHREPYEISENGALEPVPKPAPGVVPEPALHPPPSISIGERDTEGAMVFITGAPAFLSHSRGRLQIEREDETLLSLPWNGIGAIVLFGAHNVTTPVLRAALKHGVPVHFASGSGRYQGTLWNGQPGPESHTLWLQQAACFGDPEQALRASCRLVEARLRHMREVLRQRNVDHALDDKLAAIDQALARLNQAQTLSELNGFEGNATREYYEGIKRLLPPELDFNGRNRQPPRDPFNALLSLGYTVLYAHVDTVLRASGLLPWLGFYHQSRGRHAALASDLMEAFRHLVERAALSAIARGQMTTEDFYSDPERGCYLTREARKRYLALLAERFETPVTALGGTEPKTSGRLIIANLLSPVTALGGTEPKTLHQHLRDQSLALIDWIRGKVAVFEAWRAR